MSNPVISGNGIFSHVFIGAVDVQKSAEFYDATLGALGINNLGPFGNGWVLFGRDKPAFIIARPGNGEAPSSNGVTLLPPRLLKLTLSMPQAWLLAGLMKANRVLVVICQVLMLPTCVIRLVTRSAPIPSSDRRVHPTQMLYGLPIRRTV